MVSMVKCLALHGLLLLYCATTDVASSLAGLSAISIEDNGYTNVAVAIQPEVPQSDELIDKIKEMFTEASLHLYHATHHRLFFREVTIFVPQTWPAQTGYQAHSTARYENSDVVVEPSLGRNPSAPYTRQYRGCGGQGVSINFMDTFLLDPNIGTTYASLGHILLHEWGHYRWGLFDEYPDDDDASNNFYLSSLTNQFEGSRCSYNITGTPLKLDSDGVTYRECFGDGDVGYEEGCLFVPSASQQEATGSVMYSRGKYANITEFCDSDPENRTSLHNREAPSRHNRLCDRRSNWEVMREHSDLADGNNPAREMAESDLQPSFQIVRRGPVRVVLVLETSSKMQGDPFERMSSAAAGFISWVAPLGVRVGVVGYGTLATPSDLVEIRTDADRRVLLDALPTATTGLTSVGYGLFEAKALLEEDGSDTAGSRILLVNGFQEDQYPWINTYKDQLIAAEIIVDTVALTQNADPQLAELSRQTGGTFYYAPSDSSTASSLNEAFKRTIDTGDVTSLDKHFQVCGESSTLTPGEIRSSEVYLDTTIGRETKFTVSWLRDVSAATPNVTLIDPRGSLLTDSYSGYENSTDFGLVAYRIEGLAEDGLWIVVVENVDPAISTFVQVSVTSATKDADVPPILVTSSISAITTDFAVAAEPLTIYTDVRQGTRQVVNATVVASVSIPNVAEPVEVQLFDTGTGADITKEDGIYSGYLTEYTMDGFYGVEIRAENDGNAAVVDYPSSPSSRSTGPIPAADGTSRRLKSQVPAPIFKRVVSAGSSRIVNAPTAGTDTFPPGRITDLRVVASSFTDQTVTLAWTATGDDFDSGKAVSYELTRGPDLDSVLTKTGTVTVQQSDLVRGDLNDPQVAGTGEEFTLAVPAASSPVSPFAFSVVAVDDTGLRSPQSNIVSTTVRRYIPAPPETTTAFIVTTRTAGATASETTELSNETTRRSEVTGERGTISVGMSTTVVDTVRPILRPYEIVLIAILGSVGLLAALVVVSVSVSKCLCSPKVTPSRPGSGRSTEGLWDRKKQQEISTILVTDLEMQGTESEI